MFQPLDLIKTRLQAQPMVVSGVHLTSTVSLHGDITLVRSLLFKENVLGLWKGLTPSLCRTIPGVGLYFSTLEYLKGKLKISQPSSLQNFALGFSSRAFAGTVLLPVTVVKARFESGQFNYPSIGKAFTTIWRTEGMRGLYSGAGATIARDAPYSGLYLMFYGKGKEVAARVFDTDIASPVVSYACGLNAGLLASMVTQPADVIKTKMQLQPYKYRNSLDCLRIVLAESGPNGLLRGVTPRCLRRALISAMSWTVYEELLMRMKIKD